MLLLINNSVESYLAAVIIHIMELKNISLFKQDHIS